MASSRAQLIMKPYKHRRHSPPELCGKLITLKTIQTFLKASSELYQAFGSLSERVKTFVARKSSKSTRFTTKYVAPTLPTGSL